jgi:hypothetical protein
MFPECPYYSYPPHNELSDDDVDRYQLVIQVATRAREMFRALLEEREIQSSYLALYTQSMLLDWKMPIWDPILEDFFQNLRDFLTVPFVVKECARIRQSEHTTTLGTILSESAKNHIHSSCPFHMEDNFTHCVMTMFAILTQNGIDNTRYSLFQKAICALLHDIGKENTLCLTQRKNHQYISFPNHCLAGSIIVRQLWGSHFSRWFNPIEWDLMCDTILYHMCGYNRDPDPISINLLAHLPTELRTQLSDLAKADIHGALPLKAFVSLVPCLAESQDACGEVEEKASIFTAFDRMILFYPFDFFRIDVWETFWKSKPEGERNFDCVDGIFWLWQNLHSNSYSEKTPRIWCV